MGFLTEKSERIRAVEVLIKHFEGDPAAQMVKIHQETAEWENTRMLRLKIREMTGKERKTIAPS
jgi:hypothetical protein